MRECVTTDWIDYHDTSQDRNQESRRLHNRWLARRWYVKAYLNDHEYMLIYERGLTNMKSYNRFERVQVQSGHAHDLD